jgi:hypothetical protein
MRSGKLSVILLMFVLLLLAQGGAWAQSGADKLQEKKVDPGKVEQGKAFGQLKDLAGQGQKPDGMLHPEVYGQEDRLRQPVKKPGPVPEVPPPTRVDPAAAPKNIAPEIGRAHV